MRWLSAHWRRPRGGPDLAAVRARFVAIDLETTGLDSRRDAIVAAAAIPFVDGEAQPGFTTLVCPDRPIPASSTAIHGITDEMVSGAPAVGPVLHRLHDVCADHVLVGHGITFDLALLERERRRHRLGPFRNQALDTQRLAAALQGGWAGVALDAVAARLGIPVTDRHTAEGDALTAGRVFLALLPALSQWGLRTTQELLWLQDSVPG